MSYHIFLVTVPTIEEGRKIARYLVENKIAACVNIVDNITSIYEWQEKIEESSEYLLIIKTTTAKSELLIQKIEEIHSYDTPECVGFKIEKGSEKYLNWIGTSTK